MLLLKPSYPAENGLFPLKNIWKHKAASPQPVEKNKNVLHISRYLVLLLQFHSTLANAIPMFFLSLTN